MILCVLSLQNCVICGFWCEYYVIPMSNFGFIQLIVTMYLLLATALKSY